MSEVDNLESLNNAELRAKCKEYGLPNVPVTDTSRNVLIKKLRVSIGGAASPAATTKKTNRRETIAAAAAPPKVYPSIDSVKSATGDHARKASPSRATNRRTIAATQNISIAPVAKESVGVAASQPLPATVHVRSGRGVHKTTDLVDANVPSVILDSDSDDDIPVTQRFVEQKRLQQAKENAADADTFVRPRSSRSVSLSKTGVFTTSYLQEVAPLPPPTIADDEESDNSLANNMVKRNKAPLSSEQRFTSNVTKNLASRPILSSAAPLPAASSSSAALYSASPSNLFSSQQEKASRYTASAAAAPSRYTTQPVSSYFAPSSQSTLRNATVTSGYAVQSPSTGRHSDDDSNVESDQIETPYLSNFARTLDRMKATSFGGGSAAAGAAAGNLYAEESSEVTRRYKPFKSTPYQPPERRPRISTGGTSGDVTFRDIVLALEQKYNLKRNFIILLVVLLVVFLFVLFL